MAVDVSSDDHNVDVTDLLDDSFSQLLREDEDEDEPDTEPGGSGSQIKTLCRFIYTHRTSGSSIAG